MNEINQPNWYSTPGTYESEIYIVWTTLIRNCIAVQSIDRVATHLRSKFRLLVGGIIFVETRPTMEYFVKLLCTVIGFIDTVEDVKTSRTIWTYTSRLDT